MVIDASDKFLDQMAQTLYEVKLSGNYTPTELVDRFDGLTKLQRSVVNLRAAVIAKRNSRGR